MFGQVELEGLVRHRVDGARAWSRNRPEMTVVILADSYGVCIAVTICFGALTNALCCAVPVCQLV